MFKGLGNLASIMKQARQMGGQMEDVNESLQGQRVKGESGAGMVEVEANGLGEVLSVKIDPTLIQSGDREMIEDLLPGAINQASAKAKQLHMEAMRSLTDGLNIPGLDDAFSQAMGSQEMGGPSAGGPSAGGPSAGGPSAGDDGIDGPKS